MILAFNADEILELAIAMERHGARFYRAAMKYTRDQSAQDLLEELASWEEKHEAIFAGMQQALRDERPALNVFDPDGEEAKYLSALTDDRVFPKDDPTDRLTGEESFEDVLRLALQMEKDSVVFYQGIRDFADESLSEHQVAWIIKEEMRHVYIISQELRKAGEEEQEDGAGR